MNQELKKYIDDLFESAPRTKAAYELKEELLANANERYADLIKDGIPEKESLDIVIHSIGDVKELFPQTEVREYKNEADDQTIKRIALYKSVAIGMYILGFVMMIAVEEIFEFGNLGAVLLFTMAALATSILVYVGAAYPKYKKNADTMVEEFKEWNHNQKKEKAIRSSVKTILWMVVLILYFIISFVTYAWHITWVIFLVGACAQAILNLLFELKSND